MKQFLLLLFTSTIFFSCSKDKAADAQADTFSTFQGKYMVCDSVKTTSNGVTTTTILGKGKGWDLSFGLYGNLDVYSNPPVNEKYSFESPNKIYYWTNTYQSNVFYTIQSMGGNNIVLVDTNAQPGKTLTEYFTAQ